MPTPGSSYGGQTNATPDLKNQMADKLDQIADRASDTFRDVAGEAEHYAGRVAEQGRDMHEVASNLKGAVDKSIKDQPTATIVLAVAAGFLLGALWKS